MIVLFSKSMSLILIFSNSLTLAPLSYNSLINRSSRRPISVEISIEEINLLTSSLVKYSGNVFFIFGESNRFVGLFFIFFSKYKNF